MGKKRQKERFDILLFAAGLFCIGMTLWILISEISEYVQQKDWTAATAVVVDVSPHSGDYDVYYQYEAAGDIYTGKFSKVGKRALGETIEIRYNPDAPEKSNWVLEMGIKTILKDVFMIAIFWTLGARLIECSLPKKKRREDKPTAGQPAGAAAKAARGGEHRRRRGGQAAGEPHLSGGVRVGTGAEGGASGHRVCGAAGALRAAGAGGLCAGPVFRVDHRHPEPPSDDSRERRGHDRMAGRPGRDHPGEGRKAEGFRRVQGTSQGGSGKDHRRL